MKSESRIPRDDDGVKPGELVAREVEVRDAASGSEILRVWSSVDRAHGDDEAHSVRGRDLTSAPLLRERDGLLVVHEARVGSPNGLGPDVVLRDPAQPSARQSSGRVPHHGLEADVARFGEKHGADRRRDVLDPRVPLADVVNSSVQPVHAATSRRTSGRSMCGRRLSMWREARSAIPVRRARRGG